MTAATVWINGQRLGEYKGGYTPFAFELTPHVDWDRANVLAVEVDSTERADIPPFGGNIAYLTFGGIYRETSLRVVPDFFIENVFAKPVNVLSVDRRVDVQVVPNGSTDSALTITAELRDGDRVLTSATGPIGGTISIAGIGNVELWDLDHPKMYNVVV